MRIMFIITLFSMTLCAQTPEPVKELKHHNEIGIYFTDLLDGSLQLRYERLLNDHFSVSLGLGYKGESGLIALSGLDTDNIKTSDLTYSGFKIVPEVRYYFSETGTYGKDGFYLGAYLKHSSFTSNIDGTYIDSMNENFTLEFDAKLNITSVGLEIGYKLPLSKKFSIDFLMAGFGRGFHGYTIENKKDLPEEFYEDLSEALEKYGWFDLIDGSFRFSSTNRKTKFNAISFRYGISFGYSF